MLHSAAHLMVGAGRHARSLVRRRHAAQFFATKKGQLVRVAVAQRAIMKSGWTRRLTAVAGACAAMVIVAVFAICHQRGLSANNIEEKGVMRLRHIATLALAWSAPSHAQTRAAPLPPPPPVVLGINLAPFGIYSSTAPFANLAIAESWSIGEKWHPTTDQQLDRDGTILATPVGSQLRHAIMVPPTGPEGFDARCTWTGSGDLQIEANATLGIVGSHSLKVHLTNLNGLQGKPWLDLTGFDPAHPFRDLDCRDVRVARDVRFRPEALRPLRGFGVVRFMDWQHANDNLPTTWRERHLPGSLRVDGQGIAIEDMMGIANALGADPWFVMPWNADNDYITRFAQLVRALLPRDRSVYVEVGNEVWNGGFAVAKQAIAEGTARGLSQNPQEAGLRRYAQRTVEVMRIWEAVFAGRRGLVRVLATQHALPSTAETALSFADTKGHVDALATAPYVGGMLPGTGNTREAALASLEKDIPHVADLITENRRVALAYGKRYIAYEGGPALVIPAQKELRDQMQRDPALYGLMSRLLAEWERRSGDVFCLYDSSDMPTPWGMWGLAATEIDTPAQAPKLRAAQDFIAGHLSAPLPPATPIARGSRAQ